MARPGSGKRQMQAVFKKRQKKTNAFSKQIYKFLAAMATYTALMFKYLFIALWWVVKQLFRLMYMACVYTYRGNVFLVKRAAAKLRNQEEKKEE